MPILSTGSNREAGFTLIELLIAMTVLIFAAFIVVLSAGRFLKARETDSAASSLIRLTRLAREEAVDQGASYSLEYDTALRTIAVVKAEAISPLMSYTLPRGFVMEAVRPQATDQSGVDSDTDNDGWSVEFNPDGTCSGAEVTLKKESESGAEGAAVVIDIDAVTGQAVKRQAEVEEGEAGAR